MTAKRGYTILELLVIMTMVAIGVALVAAVRRSMRPEYIDCIALNANGTRVHAALADGSVVAWDAATGQQIPLAKAGGFLGSVLGFSPEGTQLARLRYDTTNQFQEILEVVDLKTGKATEVLNASVVGQSVAFSRDGRQIAYIDPQDQAQVVDLLDGSTITLGPLDGRPPQAPPTTFMITATSFSPDKKKLFVLTLDGQLQAWDLASKQALRASVTGGVGVAQKLAVSTNGNLLAVSRSDTSGAVFKSFLDLFDANTLQILQTAETSSPVTEIEFADTDKSLVAAHEGGIEIWDVAQWQRSRTIQTKDADAYLSHVAVAGDKIAAGDFMSVYIVEGNSLRYLGGIKEANTHYAVLLFALAATFIVWRVMRKRRATKTCTVCGAKWREQRQAVPLKRNIAQCPKCRSDYLTTDELRRTASAPRSTLVKLGFYICLLIAFFVWFEGGNDAWGMVGSFLRLLLMFFGLFIGLMILLVLFKLAVQWFKLRRLGKTSPRLVVDSSSLASMGETRQLGPMTVWIDGGLLGQDGREGRDAFRIPSTQELEGDLKACRERLEKLIGERCPPLPESQLYIFATTAAAQKFLPVSGISNEIPALFCGPWAAVGCITVEGMRRQLRPLRTSIQSLFSYQSMPYPKYGFQLGYAAFNHTARVMEPAAIDASRRRNALWAAKGTLLPLSAICGRQFVRTVLKAVQSSLPEHYEKSLRCTNQWLSLVDYFCGADSTSERRAQFRKLWETAKTEKKLPAAIESACGYSLTEFEARWKAWVQSASFNPPAAAPSDIAELALTETIPLARDSAAPIQRRIRAIRALGNCGWSIGAETLIELFKNPLPDIQREAFAAVRQLSGRMGTERAEDWQEWLSELDSTAPRQLVDQQI